MIGEQSPFIMNSPVSKFSMMPFLLSLLLLQGYGCIHHKKEIRVVSPNKANVFSLIERDGRLYYNIHHLGKSIILPSRLGLEFGHSASLSNDLYITSEHHTIVDETWEQPWGEVRKIKNNYRECTVSIETKGNLKHKMRFVVRVYDDGIAFRYQVDSIGDLNKAVISDEITEFNIAENATSWWIKAYQNARYELLYQSTPISEIDTVHTPLTLRLKNGVHISIHEADLKNYSSMQIAGKKTNSLHCDLAPWSDGSKVKTDIPFQTPWRTIKITDTAGELVTSYLNLNCNEPNKLGDVSWVKPSKYVGIWWGMHLGLWTWEAGPRHGATTERSKKYIDFAARNGFDEVLIEGNSAGLTGLFAGDTVTTNFIESTTDFNLNHVQNYALKKGVSIQTYHETSGGTFNYLAQIDPAFQKMKELGVSKVKIGHVGDLLDKKEYHYGQYGVAYFRKVLEKAAEYNIAVNFHEPIKDTGERRTYPNMLTREGARGMEYNAWTIGGNPPQHETILPFTRLLESPMDYTPGIFDLLYENLEPIDAIRFPVTITLYDEGNGYTNPRYKSAESFWQDKPMSQQTILHGNDTTLVWTITENMRPGEWEWGVSIHDIESDNNHLWVPDLLKISNPSVQLSPNGEISGQTKLSIHNTGLNYNKRFSASEGDLNDLGGVIGKNLRVNTTLAKQLALYVVIYSPIQMLSDFVDNYENEPALQFIKDVPTNWDTTIVLNAEIGEYISLVRKDRNSNDWYLGAITNKKNRTFEIDLSFLNANLEYIAEVYADGENADWETTPKDLSLTRVKPGNTYAFSMAKGGGHAVRFRCIE